MRYLLPILALILATACLRAADKPNIVVFLSDDHTWRDSSLYGSREIETPHMDRLGAEGMTFDQAYVHSPACAPSRAALFTGLFPARNGAEANHARPHADLRMLPSYLQELGYEVVSFGKVGHYAHTAELGFDLARHYGYHEDIAIPKAVEWLGQRHHQRPLCLFVGSNWPHVPWPEDATEFPPQSLAIPPHHVDTPSSRQWRARYLAAVRKMDDELGQLHAAAREAFGDNLFFLHTSDHGAQWPFAKWTLYEDGTRTPFVASWPGKIRAASRSQALVCWIDILPTLVEIAGGTAPAEIDGRSLLPVLSGRTERHRDRVFTTHSGDGDFNVYPMRAVRDEAGWKYIRNLQPGFLFTSHATSHPGDSGYWASWMKAAVTDRHARERVLAYQQRPPAELYHLPTDPWEQTNLMEDPQHAAHAQRLAARLDAWLEETRDPLTIFGNPRHIAPSGRPNIITVFVDDMGFADLSCFGGSGVATPHLDRLAGEGIRFRQFYVNSPICSPSRVALTTGQYPHRWRITSFLNHREDNRRRGLAPWLDPRAPVLARRLQRSGYATGHFGKWHMGGQRDVDDAPAIQQYGFDRSLTNFEGMGPKLLPLTLTPRDRSPSRIWQDAERLGGPFTWMQRSEITSGFVEAAIEFIDQAAALDRPFFVNVWPDDPHSPFFPPLERWGPDKRSRYLGVIAAMDEQLAPLFERIRRDPKLRDQTLILVCSDNGHEPGAGSAGTLRGAKTWLYEGGIRSPLIVWGPGFLAPDSAASVNEESVFAAIDLNRSLYTFTATELPTAHTLDGEDVLATMLGKSTASRSTPLFFRRPPDRPGDNGEDNPDLAVRDGKWKLLVNLDGSQLQLYDIPADPTESQNLAERFPDVAERLRQAVFAWNASLPVDASDPTFRAPES